MKKSFTLISSILVAGAVLVGCGNEAVEDSDKAQVEQETNVEEDKQQTEQTAADTNSKEEIATYQSMTAELNKAKENQEVDWKKVIDEYKETLQASVTSVDGEMDQAIQAALSAGESGELDANVARQITDKTIQAYFYQKQKGLHKDVAAALEAEDKEAANKLFADLTHVIDEVIIPTAEKRDNYYELSGDASLVENIRNGLSAQKQAIEDGNVADFSVYKQITDKSVYRSYYLAANSYAEKIEKAVAEGETDETKLKIMQAEGWGFLQAIDGSLSGGSEQAAAELNKIFSLDKTEASSIKGADVSKLFTEAFVGKITGYHEKVPASLEAGDVTKARVEAMEANVFTKDIELVLQEKLGADETKQLLDKAQKWYEAVAAEKKDDAAAISSELVSALQKAAE